MGRGRAKAKQTKVARQLKYSSPNTDLDALQRELSGGRDDDQPDRSERHDDDLDDEYGDGYDTEPSYVDDESDPESADDSEGWRAAR
jgi:hypothetical protein